MVLKRAENWTTISHAENQEAIQQTTPNHDTDEEMTLSEQSLINDLPAEA